MTLTIHELSDLVANGDGKRFEGFDKILALVSEYIYIWFNGLTDDERERFRDTSHNVIVTYERVVQRQEVREVDCLVVRRMSDFLSSHIESKSKGIEQALKAEHPEQIENHTVRTKWLYCWIKQRFDKLDNMKQQLNDAYKNLKQLEPYIERDFYKCGQAEMILMNLYQDYHQYLCDGMTVIPREQLRKITDPSTPFKSVFE